MNRWLERHRGYLFVILINLIALAGVTFTLRRPTSGLVEILPPPTLTPAPTPTPVVLTVYVSGAVIHPDVYDLPEGSRIEQAIEAAGGFTPNAFRPGINLARPLVDGQQVYVPDEEEALALGPVAVSSFADPSFAVSSDGLVDINTASVEQLKSLPGIGPSIARRIVEYRETHGRFQAIEDIKQVKGIGDAMFQKLRDLIVAR